MKVIENNINTTNKTYKMRDRVYIHLLAMRYVCVPPQLNSEVKSLRLDETLLLFGRYDQSSCFSPHMRLFHSKKIGKFFSTVISLM